MRVAKTKLRQIALEELYKVLYENNLIDESSLRKKLGSAALAAMLAGAAPAAAEPVQQDDISNVYFSDYDIKIEDLMKAGERLPADFDSENVMNPDILDKAIKYKYTQDIRDMLDSGAELPSNIDMEYIIDPEVKQRLPQKQTDKKTRISIRKSLESRITGGTGEKPTKSQLGGRPLWPEDDPASFKEGKNMKIKITEAKTIDRKSFLDIMNPIIDAVLQNSVFDALEGTEDGVARKKGLRDRLEQLLMGFVSDANIELARTKDPEQERPQGGARETLATEPMTERIKKKLKSLLVELESEKRIGDPSYIQNIYEVTVKVSIHKTRGGDREQTYTEIRGIPGVTVITVDPLGTSHDETLYYTTLIVKFELIANQDPLSYIKRTLFPGIRTIKGCTLRSSGQISKVD